MVNALGEWWKAGEDGAEKVYGRGWRLWLILITGAFAFLCYVLLPKIKGSYSDLSFLGLFYLASTALILFQARRAIIISREALISRPCLGELTVVPFAWISQVAIADPSLASMLIGYPSDRLRIQLTSGTEVYISLDVGRKKRILADLKVKAPTAFPKG